MYWKSNESIKELDRQIHKGRKKIEKFQQEKTKLWTKLEENEKGRIKLNRDMRRLQEEGRGAKSLIYTSKSN